MSFITDFQKRRGSGAHNQMILLQGRCDSPPFQKHLRLVKNIVKIESSWPVRFFTQDGVRIGGGNHLRFRYRVHPFQLGQVLSHGLGDLGHFH